jgi:fucose 4-O-acetylase-like acetyltransferase
MNPKASHVRNEYIDYLRGLLVFLVTYGHTIQYVTYQNNAPAFFNDPIFKLIYIFHMPLFMVVSGFVSFYAIERSSAFDTIEKRFHQLIVPIISWAVISRTALAFTQLDVKDSKTFESLLLLPKLIVHATLEGFWFLWCVFGSILIILILKRLDFNRFLGLLLTSFVILFLPESGNLYLFKYMFPFFCAGYLLSKNSDLYSQRTVNSFKLGLGLAVSTVCFLLWHQETYIYVSKMGLYPGNFSNITLRYFSGFVLSLTFVMLSFTLFSNKIKHSFVCELGKNSLAIYILQTYVFFIIERTNWSLEVPIFIVLLLSPLIATLICVATHYFAEFLYQYPLPSHLVLGRWIKTKTE